jgi:hypothetical protein
MRRKIPVYGAFRQGLSRQTVYGSVLRGGRRYPLIRMPTTYRGRLRLCACLRRYATAAFSGEIGAPPRQSAHPEVEAVSYYHDAWTAAHSGRPLA